MLRPNSSVHDRAMARGLLHVARVGVVNLAGLFAARSVAERLGWPGAYGLVLWIVGAIVASQVALIRREFPLQGRPFLIRCAAFWMMGVALGAIMCVCPIIASYGYWWAAPVLILLTARIVLAFGRVCEWTATLPKGPAKWASGGPSGGVGDRWLDVP